MYEKIEINTNDELEKALKDLIAASGKSKVQLSLQLGMANQNFNRLLSKKNISIDEMNRILSLVGYTAKIEIIKSE